METTVKKREWVKNVAIIVLAVLLVLTFFSNTIMNRTLPEVATTAVHGGTITSQIRGSGTVSANQSFEVKTDQTRKVKSVMVKEGQEVNAGDLLFVLSADSEELEAATEQLRQLQKSYQTALINASGSGSARTETDIQRTKEDLAEAEADRDENAWSQEDLDRAEQTVKDKEAALEGVAAQLRDAGHYEAVTPEGVLELRNATLEAEKSKEKNYTDAKRELETAKLKYGKQYETLQKRAESTIKESNEYRMLPESRQEAYIQENLAAYMEYIVFRIENDTLFMENIRYDENGEPHNDPEVVKKYREAFDTITAAQAKLDTAEEAYRTGNTELLAILDGAKAALDEYADAKAELEKLQTQKETYEAAVEKVRTLQRQLEDLEIAQIDAGKSASLSWLEIQDISRQIEKQQAKVDELTANSEGSEITADVGGVISSISVTPGSSTVPNSAMATIDLPDMGYLVSFSVSADQARRVHVGDAASAANVYWGSQIEAVLTGIKNDPKDPQNSRVLSFEVSGDVSVGSTLTLTVGQRGADYDLIVPRSAIRPDSRNGDYVLVVTAKNSPLGDRYIATRVPVEVLARDDVNAAVTGALEEGDFVVTTSSAPIDNGKRVRLADTQ